ncbi:MAG: CvpA family protein [Bacilli bacterium]
MNIVDAIILLILGFGAVVGFKRGFTKEVISFLGIFVIVILSFLLKNPVSVILYEHLPFFPFGGIIKGVTVLNIALYEFVALIIVMGILMLVLKLLKFTSSIFEKMLSFTILLGFPSKILGALIGLIEAIVWIFIALYILNLPVFNIDVLNESKYKDYILNNTPVLSNFSKDSMNVIEEFVSLKDKYETTPNAAEFNKETLDLFLKYNIVTIENVDKLIKLGKIKIDTVEDVLKCYREDTKNSDECIKED